MGMDISCIGGIGFEVSELLCLYKDHKLTKEYYNEEEEDICQESILDDFFENAEHIDVQYLHSYEDTEYYIFANDPINGVKDFLNELDGLGFKYLSTVNLKFHSNAKVW